MDCIIFDCRAVLFDCDGVLVDSTTAGESAWREWAHIYELNEQAVLEGIHGRRSVETVAMYLPEDARAQALRTIEEIEIRSASVTKPLPGAVQALESLDDNWAIVTSASPALVGARLAAAQLRHPEVLITGDDVTSGKPEPEGYLLAASQLAANPADCVVFEDSATGVNAALAARAGVVVGVGATALKTDAHIVVRDLTGTTWSASTLAITTETILRAVDRRVLWAPPPHIQGDFHAHQHQPTPITGPATRP